MLSLSVQRPMLELKFGIDLGLTQLTSELRKVIRCGFGKKREVIKTWN